MSSDHIPDYSAGDEPDPREADRFASIHDRHDDLNDLADELGTPEEWLGTAISHLKLAGCEARRDGLATVTVSLAALDLLMWDWEARAVGGAPWKGNLA